MDETTHTPAETAVAPPVPSLAERLADPRRTSGLDLRGECLVDADLRGLDLSSCDLRGADLSRADLRDAHCAGVLLDDANLYEANLGGCELVGASLRRANLQEVQAECAGFGRVDLQGANLFSCHLDHAVFTDADLRDADLRGASLVQARLRCAALSGADLSGADMQEAVLEESEVAGACFDGADLRRSLLREVHDHRRASWIGCDVRDVNFAGAWMLRRTVLDQNYLHEFRQQGRLAEFVYRLWWITSDCGRSAGRWLAFVSVIVLSFAWFYSIAEIDFGAHPTALSPLYFSVVTLTTLGFGDVVPASIGSQVLVILQVSFGYVGLGGLLSILTTKMTRRAE